MMRSILMAVALAAVAPSAHSVERQGFLIGFSIGGGALDCDACAATGAVAFGFHLGGSIGSRVALVADISGLSHEESLVTVNSYLFTGVLRFWPASRVWLGAGLGFGQNEIQFGNFSEWGDEHFAFLVEAGVEALQRRRFVLDVRARYSRISTPGQATNAVVGLLGFTWY